MRFWLAALTTLATFGLARPAVALARESTVTAQSLPDRAAALDRHAETAATRPTPPHRRALASLVAVTPRLAALASPQALRTPFASAAAPAQALRSPARPSARAPPIA